MGFRKPFNWSLLDRYNLHSMLNEVGSSIVGKKLSIAEIHKILSTHIKSHLPIRVKYKEDPGQEPGLIYIGGTYYADYDKGGQRHIEVVLSYHLFDQHLKLTRARWNRTCSLFADTILHEIVHMRQYRTRNFKSIPGYESTAHLTKQRRDQEYYGDKDEIGAFAFNIACELVDKFGYNPDEIWKYLDSDRAKRNKRSTYLRYLRAFDFNHNHKIMRKMKRKVMHQLENAYYGKPFKTTDHLTY
jgi:hypothetical protein